MTSSTDKRWFIEATSKKELLAKFKEVQKRGIEEYVTYVEYGDLKCVMGRYK